MHGISMEWHGQALATQRVGLGDVWMRRAPGKRPEPAIQIWDCDISAQALQDEVTMLGSQDDWVRVIIRRRRCDFFERHRPGLSVRDHLDLQTKRRERFWGFGGVVLGAVVGATVTALLRVL